MRNSSLTTKTVMNRSRKEEVEWNEEKRYRRNNDLWRNGFRGLSGIISVVNVLGRYTRRTS